jgi:predicted N-acetyltransferase YhbS
VSGLVLVAPVIRRERAGDVAAIRDVHRAAFGGADPVEARLVDALRADPGWLPHFSLVAVRDGAVVGHVVATRAWVGDVAALGVGPLGVLPGEQRRGVGSALMYALLSAAQAVDETLLGLVGSPDYYGRFGFVAGTEHGIAPPDPVWGRHFQVLSLAGRPPAAGFRYAAPFDEL